MNKVCGVYSISNDVDGKFYIGSSVDVKDRLKHHKSTLKHGRHENVYLQNAYDKYGVEHFKFEVIETVDEPRKLLELEQKWIDRTCCYEKSFGYNIAGDASAPMTGRKHTPESIKKMSESQKALCRKMSPEHKAILRKYSSGKNSYWATHKHTQEYRDKMSKSLIGNKHLLGHTHTDETKKKMRGRIPWNKGRTGVYSQETLAIMSSKAAHELQKVNMFDKEGNILNSFDSIKEAGKATGLHPANIMKCCSDKYPSNQTCGGYVWKYKI